MQSPISVGCIITEADRDPQIDACISRAVNRFQPRGAHRVAPDDLGRKCFSSRGRVGGYRGRRSKPEQEPQIEAYVRYPLVGPCRILEIKKIARIENSNGEPVRAQTFGARLPVSVVQNQ